MNVEDWLRDFYIPSRKTSKQVNHELPSFERNKVTLEVLNLLFTANKTANEQADEELKTMKILQGEYSAEEGRLSNIISLLGIQNKCSSSEELFKLAKIVSLATYHLPQISSLDDEEQIGDLPTDLTSSLQRLQNLEKVRDSLNQMNLNENQDNNSKRKETEFLSKKSNEYVAHVRHLEKKLEAADFRPSIRHGSLEKKSHDLSSAKDKLALIRNKLSIYSDLTPDSKLAKIQVQHLKDELRALESQITDNISNINSS